VDNDEYRMRLPAMREAQFTPSMIWSSIKDLIGKDLTTVSLPIFINEPLTTLQKSCEMMCFCDEFFQVAINEEDSLKRMIYIAASNAATYSLV
jgi:hypothetical protein